MRKFTPNPYARVQVGMRMYDLFPLRQDGLCACGCGAKLTGRRTRWATKECESAAVDHYWIVYGNGTVIRRALFKRDRGVCARCGYDAVYDKWEADHIVPVHRGGGFCDLDNLQTLCVKCHKQKTKEELQTV